MANRKRNKQVIFRMTEEEYLKFLYKAKKSNLKQNEYLINCITEKDIIVIDGLRETLIELNRIGANVNQISKNLNGGIFTGAEQEVKEIRKNLTDLKSSIIEVLEKVN
jgi:uncharacterized phage-like protein YoqJ